ncbi:MAG: PEP-CTERM sorting domain-containing protein [Armatimonadota bacterium]
MSARQLRFAVLVLVAGCLMVLPVQAQPVFQHLKAFNVSALFDGTAASAGDAVLDVAFDGTDVYLAGFRATAGVGTVGVIRMQNVLNLPSGTVTSSTTGVERIIDVNAAGASRDTRLVYYNGYLYLGTGLGHNTSPDSAIRKYAPDGTLVTSWAGDGVLSLQEAGFSRYDTLEIDPGYGGSGPSLAVASLNATSPQPIKRFSLETGELLGTSNAVMPTFLRDIAFAPNGNVYVHRASSDANDGIFVAARTGVDSYATPSALVPVDEGNLQEATVTYVPAGQVFPSLGDLIAYNRRPATPSPETNKLFFATLSGNVVGSLDGSGVTQDGVDLGTYKYNLINAFPYLTQDGKLLLFVVSGHTSASPAGTIDRLDVYQAVPEPASLMILGTGVAALFLRRRRA